MNVAKQVYSQLYRLFDECTPLAGDCGRACAGACCTDEGGEGMFLYPGEKQMLAEADFLSIQSSAFVVQGQMVPIAICGGKCDRRLRPLACRIFPLFPYVKPGSRPKIIMDPRANAVCPIARNLNPSQLEPAFFRNVERTALLLSRFSASRVFLEEQSNLLDEMCGSYEILRRILSD